ncbi:hypothetical protein [Cupriavidus agavae]|uniref:Uncharacterized protein n=1 Tax=Cupriavidus agavae TaxID=1001822 RepID=A0A4Q7S8R8_9BURK|nr:hypothetical protein [Cupriavidus agavae]RZT42871.1 hypothetical protein EV147_1916 [Cupriavidus agavae]
MSLSFHLFGSAQEPDMSERFAEAEKIQNREARWTAQAEIALDTGDMYLVGLVLFKAIQEYGVAGFAERSGVDAARLQRLWMPGMIESVDHAGHMFAWLGVTLPVERFYKARLDSLPSTGAVMH